MHHQWSYVVTNTYIVTVATTRQTGDVYLHKSDLITSIVDSWSQNLSSFDLPADCVRLEGVFLKLSDVY